MGGPIKLGLLEGSKLGPGLVGPVLASSSPLEVGPSSVGPTLVEESRWAKVKEAIVVFGPARPEVSQGLLMPLLETRARFGEAPPLEWSGPSPLRSPDAETSLFWEMDV